MTVAEEERRPRVGIGVLIFRDGRLLLGKRKGSHGAGTWALPGGHLEFQETLEACAVREVAEETGLAISSPRVEWVENSFFSSPEQPLHYLTVFMRAELANSAAEPQLLEPEKCEGWRWVEWGAMPRPLFQPLQQMLDSSYDPSAGSRLAR